MTKDEYHAAIAEIKILWGAPPGTPDGDRLSVLCEKVVTYVQNRLKVHEDIHYPIHDTEFPMDNLD